MALKLGELVAILRTDNSGLTRGLAEGKAEVEAAGSGMGRSADQAGKNMGDKLGAGGAAGGEKFTRDVTGRMRDARGRFVAEGERIGRGLGDGMGNGARGNTSWMGQIQNAVRNMGAQFGQAGSWIKDAYSKLSDFAGGVSSAVSGIWGFIQTLAMFSAAVAFAIPLVSLLGGAIGSLPALAVGAGAGLGVLMLGFSGLTDQFQKHARAGGAVVDKTWQIAMAERQVRDANREVLDSQLALNKAREDAAERIDDLNRSLAGAHLDERAAIIAVSDAQKELVKAQMTGDPDQIARAQLAYDQANQSLTDIRDRLEDMTLEQKRNAQQGVEGSDEVKAALDRQRKAVEGVTDAQHALREAQKPAPGGGGAAQQMTKLAASAQAVVDVIKALKPAWESLRLDVQQRLFAGVAGEIRSLASAWLPTLHSKLGAMATTFNGLFKIFADHAKKPEFIKNISEGLDAVNTLVGTVGKALAGPFVDAFGKLAKDAAPFLKSIGGEVGKLITDFSKWIDKADKSGALKDFFKKAGDFFHDVVSMGKDVGAIIGDIVKALFDDPKNKDGGKGWTDFKKTLDDLRKWFDDPKNQKQIQDWFHKLELAAKVLLLITGWISGIILWLDKADTKFREWCASVAKAVDHLGKWLDDKWDKLVKAVSGLPGRIGKAASGMWDGIKNSFKSAINWIIGKWNGLSFNIPGVSVPGIGQIWGGTNINMPHIPMLAQGGIVRATPGGRLVVAGEGGEDEAVAPLSKLGGLGGVQEIRLTGELRASGSDLVVVLRERVALGGGNVQKVVGANA